MTDIAARAVRIRPATPPDDTDTAANTPRPPVFLPRAEVERRVGLRRSAIYRRLQDGTFPAPVHDIHSATVWWLESEIEAWQNERIAARAGAGGDANMGRSMGKNL